ncbi:MAG TPA: PQQ-binding-like beta-propeller repeat protein [Dehalococcoidales bacterium]
MKKVSLGLGKVLLALTLVVVLLALAACTKTTTTPLVTTTPPVSTTTTTTTTPTTTTTTPTTTTTTPTTTSTTPVSAVPPEVTQYAKDWPLPNKDYNNSRATTDSTITSANVGTLGVAWASPIPGSFFFGAATTMPIIMGNTVYYQDTDNNVIALDKTTGKTLWQKLYNTPTIGPNGIAIGWGKIFAQADPYDMVALDMNGNELWRTNISQLNIIGVDMQPTVYNGQVLVSSVPGVGISSYYAGGAYGTFYGLDQQTGKVTWSWLTVDSTALWGNATVNSGGGAWYPPAIDTKTGMTFWGVGNPAPYPGTTAFPNGTSHPGNNLYTDSMVALDSSGKLQWYNQVLPHDIMDHDFQIGPILASANVNGTQTDIAIGSGKGGKVVAFDRKTGKQLWNIPVGKHSNDDLTSIPDGQTVTVFPGTYGGVETPMAYANGIVYVPVVNLSMDLTGSTLASQSFKDGTGDLVALDVNTGNVLWDKQLPALDVGGATVVNDLVFTATYDGTIYAFNATTGAQVWTYKAGGGINAWPSVSGDTIIWPVGLGSVPSVLAFKLGANTTPVLNISPKDGATVTSGNVTVSAQVFNFNIVDKLGQAAAAGEGHLHFFMDVDAPTTQGQPAVTAQGTYAATNATTYTWQNVTPGTHTFSVELANNDHTPLNPPVIAKSTVTVVAPTPAISITIPANNSIVPAGDVTIAVQVSNFKIVDALGQAAVAGQGHIHYFMDVDAPTTQGQPAVTAQGTYAATIATNYTWHNVAPGKHTFSVELANNDHTPLNPPVVAKITVTVIAATGGQAGP